MTNFLRVSKFTFCLVLVALFVNPLPLFAGQKLAVIVGVNRYDHQNLTPLKFAVRDATELGAILQAKAGFTVTLLTDDSPTKPTRANIHAQIKSVLEKCQKGDTAVLAFAGHGAQFDGTADAFFCPSDARPFADRAETMVSMNEVYGQLGQSFAGVRVLLVDACRDDPSASRGVNADNTPRPPRGVAALFSCSAGERAFEDARLKHGVFFHHVLRGLEGEAKDKDGDVTFEGLSAYVRKRVSRQVPELIGGGAKQSPNLKADLSGESPVLISGLGVAPQPPTPAKLELMEFVAFKKIKLTRRSDRPDPLGIIEIHFPDAIGDVDLQQFDRRWNALPGLQSIDLGGTRVTDAGLAVLTSARQATMLIVSDTSVGDDGLKHLAGLSALEVLDLGGTSVSDDGLANLAGLTRLKRLVLADCAVSDRGIEQIVKMAALESLDLGRTKVTGAAMESLARMPGLRKLRLTGTSVTAADATRLRTLNPKLSLER